MYITFSEETYNDLMKLLNRVIVSSITLSEKCVTIHVYEYPYCDSGFSDVTKEITLDILSAPTENEYNFPLPDDLIQRKDANTYINRLLYLVKRRQLSLVI